MELIRHIDWFALLAVVVVTGIALRTDLQCHRIPNWLTVPATLLGLTYHTVTQGSSGVFHSVGGFAAGFGVLLVLWLIGGGGGGDVKLLGAVGSWLGPLPVMTVFAGSSVAAVLCAATLVGLRASRRSTAPGTSSGSSTSAVATGPSFARQTIPYALPLCMTIWSLVVLRCFA